MLHLRLLILILILPLPLVLNATEVLAQGKNMRVAFVLLSEPRLPKREDVVRSFSAFATKGQGIQLGKSEVKADSEILEFDLKPNV